MDVEMSTGQRPRREGGGPTRGRSWALQEVKGWEESRVLLTLLVQATGWKMTLLTEIENENTGVKAELLTVVVGMRVPTQWAQF